MPINDEVYYDGVRTKGDAKVWRRDRATTAPLATRNDVRNHSPDGFEWGYGGSGPAQLALAVCIDALGGDVARAQRIYQDFKFAVIARLDARAWTLSRSTVLETIEKLERKHGLAPLRRCEHTSGADARECGKAAEYVVRGVPGQPAVCVDCYLELPESMQETAELLR